MALKLYDTVILKDNVETMSKGAKGTIVEIWEPNHLFEVEFLDENGQFLALLTLTETQIEAAE